MVIDSRIRLFCILQDQRAKTKHCYQFFKYYYYYYFIDRTYFPSKQLPLSKEINILDQNFLKICFLPSFQRRLLHCSKYFFLLNVFVSIFSKCLLVPSKNPFFFNKVLFFHLLSVLFYKHVFLTSSRRNIYHSFKHACQHHYKHLLFLLKVLFLPFFLTKVIFFHLPNFQFFYILNLSSCSFQA